MQSFLNPNQILKQLPLRENMTAADFGCGSGGWVIPLAKLLEQGKVYAIDILEEPLSALKAKIGLEKIINVEAMRTDIEKGTRLSSECCDLILMTNLFFQIENKKAVLEEGKRALKKGGKILVVDWLKDNPLTKEIEQVSFEEVKEIAQEIGLKLEKEFEAGVYHHGLIFAK